MARSPLQAALPQSAARGLIQRGARLSRVVQGGLLLCAAGAIADLAGHAGFTAAAGGPQSAEALQYGGHLLAMAGMTLILLQVVSLGLRHRPRGPKHWLAQAPPVAPGEGPDA
ncbi:MAG: hypothetical protein C4289_10140 [Chloroflexota bacterium]